MVAVVAIVEAVVELALGDVVVLRGTVVDVWPVVLVVELVVLVVQWPGGFVVERSCWSPVLPRPPAHGFGGRVVAVVSHRFRECVWAWWRRLVWWLWVGIAWVGLWTWLWLWSWSWWHKDAVGLWVRWWIRGLGGLSAYTHCVGVSSLWHALRSRARGAAVCWPGRCRQAIVWTGRRCGVPIGLRGRRATVEVRRR
ncbi:MAG: hypothetical protein H6512_06580 [Acidimicrobiia bacterium]|nr:hypothetical protein [Acidimicrobiia bacterium]